MRVPLPAARMMAAMGRLVTMPETYSVRAEGEREKRALYQRPCHDCLANSIARLAGAHAMTNFSFDIVGFDLDGTFLNTIGDLRAAVNFTLGEAGRAPLTVEQVMPMIGAGAKIMLERTL